MSLAGRLLVVMAALSALSNQAYSLATEHLTPPRLGDGCFGRRRLAGAGAAARAVVKAVTVGS